MALKMKQVQMQSGAKQGLQCDGRHTAAHMLFKMVYYSSAVVICRFFVKYVACCLLFTGAAWQFQGKSCQV